MGAHGGVGHGGGAFKEGIGQHVVELVRPLFQPYFHRTSRDRNFLFLVPYIGYYERERKYLTRYERELPVGVGHGTIRGTSNDDRASRELFTGAGIDDGTYDRGVDNGGLLAEKVGLAYKRSEK